MRYTVLTASKSSGIGSGLTYESDDQKVQEGSYVRVPLRNRLVDGIVLAREERKMLESIDLKRIKEILGDVPLLTQAHIQALRWMSEYYCTSLRQALSVWLPPAPWANLLPPLQTSYRLANRDSDVRGKNQRLVIEYLSAKEWVAVENLRSESGASAATLKSLVQKGILEVKGETEKIVNFPLSISNSVSLTTSQESAFQEISNDPRPSLLFGITGSGKTEVYASLIEKAVNAGKQAILLVPEILLTEHTITRFTSLMPEDHIAVLHSKLTDAQRRKEWRRIYSGAVSLVIGSRSALFAPLQHLGLVILDEEHEWTYKNEQTPRYHARETAESLCRFATAKLVLGSATPSLESWSRAKSGQYHLARLPDRFGGATLPTVRVIDLVTASSGKHFPFTTPLLEAIDDRLKKGEQSILFLNRRGVGSAVLCMDCRRRIVSPESQLPFTVHRGPDGHPFLLDHTSGLTGSIPSACPSCHSVRLRVIGAGTQRIEETLGELFPRARLLRADSDTLEKPEQMRELLSKMRKREADILLGTQSVAKGLDLPEVTLAAVLIADIGLSLPHFRAGERIFQLLTQLTGRSGRAKPGEVIIQTFRPDSPEVKLAATHAVEPYLEQELRLRIHAGYPPAADMIRVIVRGESPKQTAERIALQARGLSFPHPLHVSVSPTMFGGGKVWHIFMRGTDARAALRFLDLRGAVIDIDPIECI